MQGTRSNFSSVFLVIDMQVAKTATSFLTFQGICLHGNFFAYKYNIWYGLDPWLCFYPSWLP